MKSATVAEALKMTDDAWVTLTRGGQSLTFNRALQTTWVTARAGG